MQDLRVLPHIIDVDVAHLLPFSQVLHEVGELGHVLEVLLVEDLRLKGNPVLVLRHSSHVPRLHSLVLARLLELHGQFDVSRTDSRAVDGVEATLLVRAGL